MFLTYLFLQSRMQDQFLHPSTQTKAIKVSVVRFRLIHRLSTHETNLTSPQHKYAVPKCIFIQTLVQQQLNKVTNLPLL